MNLIKSIYKFLSPQYQTLFLEYKVKLQPRYGHGKPAHSLLLNMINEQRETFSSNLETFIGRKEKFLTIKTSEKETNSELPSWNNGYLPGLDIVALYCMIESYKPNVYIEIGSGNSTKVAKKSIQDNGLNTKIISIDPTPRAEIDALADNVIRKPLEELTDFSIFDKLDKGDILFIDNSHRCLPNSDVTVCFLEIIPKLKRGVIVHIHDIYLPYDYPQFMCDRFYSEQYLLATMLLANPSKFKIIMPCFFVSEDKELSSKMEQFWNHPNFKNVEQHGGSFWFVIS
jgi:hypothetical protein